MLATLALMFGKLSLLAVGGVNSTLPAIARQVVDVRHWLTPEQFAQIFSIAQAAPGPNMLVVVLIGDHVAGVWGGLVAGAAIILPAGVLVIIVSRVWDQHREARWRRIIQAAILPITAGLVLAAAWVLMRQADQTIITGAITAAAALIAWRTRLHPLWLLAGGAAAGLLLLR